MSSVAQHKTAPTHNRPSLKRKQSNAPIADDVPKTCVTCKQQKTAGDFHVHRAASDGRSYYCKVCTKKAQIDEISKSPESFIKMRFNKAKQDAREKSLEFDLTVEFLVGLFHKQGRACPVTVILKNKMPDVYGDLDERLTWRYGEEGHGGRRGYCMYPQNISIDRIDPEKGYTRDNIQLVTTKMNRELCGVGSCLRKLISFVNRA